VVAIVHNNPGLGPEQQVEQVEEQA
jgi:hypothetical protein